MKRIVICIIMIATIVQSSCGDDPCKPVLENYDWDLSEPQEQGLDPQALDSAFVHMKDLGFVDCLLIVRNGSIVGEEYYNGHTRNTPHDVKSVSKCFLSALIGLAMREGAIDDPEKKVMDYFPEYVYEGIDERKFDITVRHLLTMRMGIDGEENTFETVIYSDNWIRKILELPLINAPGERYLYNTLQTHLLSAVLTRACGESSYAFAKKFLFEPMGISIAEWTRDPQGYYFGGGEMYFTPRNMAVLGYMYLNRGSLNGVRIVPEEWVDLSLTPTWSEDSPEWGALKNYNYGFLWWLGEIGGHGMYMALGYAGQTIIVFPGLDMIVVTTARCDIPPGVEQERPILGVVSEYILPAVMQ